ncbi:hypothetical protein FQN51_000807 [Onygenales sp. PD_10]|nr:hypothetical protein FQN51_000807 [Onygenales sp. PD_10]
MPEAKPHNEKKNDTNNKMKKPKRQDKKAEIIKYKKAENDEVTECELKLPTKLDQLQTLTENSCDTLDTFNNDSQDTAFTDELFENPIQAVMQPTTPSHHAPKHPQLSAGLQDNVLKLLGSKVIVADEQTTNPRMEL